MQQPLLKFSLGYVGEVGFRKGYRPNGLDPNFASSGHADNSSGIVCFLLDFGYFRPIDIHTLCIYVVPMLRRLNIFMDAQHLKRLAAIAKKKGLKTAQLVRLAISEYLERNEGQKK